MMVVVSRQADRDLIEIYTYLYLQSPRSADRIVDDIKDCFLDLSLFPHRGALRSDVGMNVRCVFVHPYQIFYVVDRAHIEILRVLHGSRDTKREFPS